MYDVVANSAEVVAAVLGIAVTVVAIIVELAATRYNHRITTLFVREPKNIAVLTFFVLTVLLCIWVSATTSPDSGTIWHAITLTMISASLIMLLPYFAYVFAFISPLSVIRHISALAVKALDRPDISRSRHVVIDSVDELQDVLRSAIDAGDRDIAMEAVYGLSGLLERYTDVRSTLSPEWFELHPTIAADPDFVRSPDIIARG